MPGEQRAGIRRERGIGHRELRGRLAQAGGLPARRTGPVHVLGEQRHSVHEAEEDRLGARALKHQPAGVDPHAPLGQHERAGIGGSLCGQPGGVTALDGRSLQCGS